MEETNESPIMTFYFDEHSPSGVGFETIDDLAVSDETICMAITLAAQISDKLPDEAKQLMLKENVPLFRLFTDQKGFWGEWCSVEGMDVDEEMNRLLQQIGKVLKEAAEH